MNRDQVLNFERYLVSQIVQSNKSADKFKSFKKVAKAFRRDAEVFESTLIAFRFIKSF